MFMSTDNWEGNTNSFYSFVSGVIHTKYLHLELKLEFEFNIFMWLLSFDGNTDSQKINKEL